MEQCRNKSHILTVIQQEITFHAMRLLLLQNNIYIYIYIYISHKEKKILVAHAFLIQFNLQMKTEEKVSFTLDRKKIAMLNNIFALHN
jgi:hypothetical protein